MTQAAGLGKVVVGQVLQLHGVTGYRPAILPVGVPCSGTPTSAGNLRPLSKPVATQERRPGTRINAVDLYTQYQANEVEADRRYLDRVLQVEGTIEGIRKAEDFTVLGGIKKELVVDFYVGQLGHTISDLPLQQEEPNAASEAVQGPVHCRGRGVCKGAEFGNVSLQDCRIIRR